MYRFVRLHENGLSWVLTKFYHFDFKYWIPYSEKHIFNRSAKLNTRKRLRAIFFFCSTDLPSISLLQWRRKRNVECHNMENTQQSCQCKSVLRWWLFKLSNKSHVKNFRRTLFDLMEFYSTRTQIYEYREYFLCLKHVESFKRPLCLYASSKYSIPTYQNVFGCVCVVITEGTTHWKVRAVVL